MLRRLGESQSLLIRPEFLEAYSAAIVNAARRDESGQGQIRIATVYSGDFHLDSNFPVADDEQRAQLIKATVEMLLHHGLGFRWDEQYLCFPSMASKAYEPKYRPSSERVIFEFVGAVSSIYATLAVDLANSHEFMADEIWKDCVAFRSSDAADEAGRLGIRPRSFGDGSAQIIVFVEGSVASARLAWFQSFVHGFLKREVVGLSAKDVVTCSQCGDVAPRDLVELWKSRGHTKTLCPSCDEPLNLNVEDRNRGLAVDVEKSRKRSRRRREREAANHGLPFDAFLSYSRNDEAFVCQLADQLIQRGLSICFDRYKFVGGEPWLTDLLEQLESSGAIVVIVGSKEPGPIFAWETQIAMINRLYNRQSAKIIPVILPGVEEPHERLSFMRVFHFVDARGNNIEHVTDDVIKAIEGNRDCAERSGALR